MENKVICSLPFKTIYNGLGLNYSPCCWNDGSCSKKNPHNTLPIDHFTGDEFNKIRKEMISGEKTDFLKGYCGTCWQQELEFGSSPRLSHQITEQDLKRFDADGNLLESSDRFLSIKINFYGNYCNLECFYCHPKNSTSRTSATSKLKNNWKWHSYGIGSETDIEKINKSQFEDIISNIKNNANIISNIEICGGEPVLLKSHFKLLDELIESGNSSKIEITYVSNMTLMELPMMKKYFDNFRYTNIQWSVDALDERNNWIRYPTDWKKTVDNATKVRDYLIENKRGKLEATMTPSIFSITTFRETYGWLFLNDFINFNNLFFNSINDPEFLNPRHLPDELKQKIAPKILPISKFHYNQLMSKRDQNMFLEAIKYCDDLDQSRGTNWRIVFPEIAKYAP
jgi:organic radical activating enzyme